MKIVAEHITSENFRPYGTCIDLYQNQALVKHFSTDSFADHMTIAPLIDTPGHLGLTVGSPAPYSVGAMEKHAHTQEAIFCLAEPVILCVAASRGNEPPLAEDVRAFRGICIKCGACIKKCPKGAKYYDDPGYLYHKEELELGYARRAEPALFL